MVVLGQLFIFSLFRRAVPRWIEMYSVAHAAAIHFIYADKGCRFGKHFLFFPSEYISIYLYM